MATANRFQIERQMVSDAISQFPTQFSLRAFPGKIFTISESASYVSDGVVYLYTAIQDGDRWNSFCKGTVNELKSQIVEVK